MENKRYFHFPELNNNEEVEITASFLFLPGLNDKD